MTNQIAAALEGLGYPSDKITSASIMVEPTGPISVQLGTYLSRDEAAGLITAVKADRTINTVVVTNEPIAPTEDTSDGYHTFGELYAHRRALTVALARVYPSWRSREHHEGGDPMFPGYFIVGVDLPSGMITYHYKIKYWDEFEGLTVLDHAPEWDGASADECLVRLHAAHPEPIQGERKLILTGVYPQADELVAWVEDAQGVRREIESADYGDIRAAMLRDVIEALGPLLGMPVEDETE